MHKMTFTSRILTRATWSVSLVAVASSLGQTTGPTSSDSPYLLGAAAGVQTVSLLTVGDSAGGARLVGVPDGIGAFGNNDGTFTVVVNHELLSSQGIVRAHGGKGAFVSKWIIDKDTLAVLSGSDQIQTVFLWNAGTMVYDQVSNAVFKRFCSGDLAPTSAFFNAASGLGTQEMIYTNGEETGQEGRAFAHVLSGASAGQTYELARCGNLSFENALAAPGAGDTTVVIGLEDATGGQVYVYVGQKTSVGNEIDKAGLTNGNLFGLVVTGLPSENVSNGLGGPTSRAFSLHNFGDVSAWDGAMLQSQSNANNVTTFLRPEDGHFDPNKPSDFYWVTTGASGGPGRLWRLRFNDITNPASGGTIDMLLDGTEGIINPDNVSVDGVGHVLIQEDRGSSSALARIWLYNAVTDSLTLVAQHDAAFFQSGGANFLTTNEESSGIIDARSILGDGWFLCDVQAHFTNSDPELVQGGQLVALFIPQAAFGFGDLNCDGARDLLDVDAFVLALIDPAAYGVMFPACDQFLADVNGDGLIDGRDVGSYVSLLLTGTP